MWQSDEEFRQGMKEVKENYRQVARELEKCHTILHKKKKDSHKLLESIGKLKEGRRLAKEYEDEVTEGRREIRDFQEPEILEDGINKFSEEKKEQIKNAYVASETHVESVEEEINDEFVDPSPKIEALNFSTVIETVIFKKPPLIFENAVILVNRHPFDEIPQPSQVKLSKSEPIFVKKLEIRRDMFCEYDWWVFKTRWKIKKLQETEVQSLNSFVFQFFTTDDVNVVVLKHRWR
jgi:hypothetical protein